MTEPAPNHVIGDPDPEYGTLIQFKNINLQYFAIVLDNNIIIAKLWHLKSIIYDLLDDLVKRSRLTSFLSSRVSF